LYSKRVVFPVSKNNTFPDIADFKQQTLGVFMKLINILIGFLIGSAFVNAFADTPVDTKPLRFGTAHLVVIRSDMSVDPVTRKIETVRSTVCDKSVPIPVYDFRIPGSSFAITPVDCETDIGGTKFRVYTSAMVAYSKNSLFSGGPIEDLKMISTWNYVNEANGDFPRPPAQHIMTRDLLQKNFIALSETDQYYSCNPANSTGTDCSVHNPVVFNILWDFQDSQ
jgi:hypothetical protein